MLQPTLSVLLFSLLLHPPFSFLVQEEGEGSVGVSGWMYPINLLPKLLPVGLMNEPAVQQMIKFDTKSNIQYRHFLPFQYSMVILRLQSYAHFSESKHQ